MSWQDAVEGDLFRLQRIHSDLVLALAKLEPTRDDVYVASRMLRGVLAQIDTMTDRWRLLVAARVLPCNGPRPIELDDDQEPPR